MTPPALFFASRIGLVRGSVVLALIVLVTACDVWNSGSTRSSDPGPVWSTTEVILDDPDAPTGVRGEPISIVGVPGTEPLVNYVDAALLGTIDASDGGVINLKVRYTGGCRDHHFTLVASPSFLETVPVQSRARLYHDDRNDPCEAQITETVQVRLQPLTKAYRTQYGLFGNGSLAYDLRFDQGVVTIRVRVLP